MAKENSEVKYLEPEKDEEMPQPKTSNRKRKASGICTSEEPAKYRTVVIESHVAMRNKMLEFLNKFHKATNGNAAYELPDYLTEAEARKAAGGLKDDEDDADVEAFGGDDL